MIAPARARLGKLAPQFGIIFVLAMLLAGGAVLLFTQRELEAMVDQSLIDDIARISAPIGARSATVAQIADRVRQRERERSISEVGHALMAADGRRVAGMVRVAGVAQGFSDIKFRENAPRIRDGRALAVMLPGGAMLVAVAHSEIAEDMERIMWPVLLLTSAGALATGLGASFMFGRMIADRLSSIRFAADAIVAGDLSRRVPVRRLDGLFAEQARSFNRMLDRIEELMANVRQFSADIAHDLRTPITRIHTFLDEAKRGGSAARDRAIDQARRECASILGIFDALLRLSEIEAGRRRVNVRPVALAALVEDVVETMEPALADRGQSLRIGPLDPVTAMADPDLLNQLIVNLLENVAHHTPRGTVAVVSLTADVTSGFARICVADDGPGIAAADHDRVLRRFVRLDGARSSAGNGLGLAIADAVARFHGGSLTLNDNRPGLIVCLSLPATVPGHAPCLEHPLPAGSAL